jgi:hypothetical protein
MSVNSCFSQVIGLTRKQDLCVEGYLPVYDDSLSGLYVDELPGMPQRWIDSLGGNYDIWEKYTNSFENAINAFKIDVLAEILKTKEPIRNKFIGDIGGKSFSSKLPSATYHGLRMYSDIWGGSFTLRGISLILDVTEAVDVLIYDDYDLLHTLHLNATANRPRYNAITPIELPLGSQSQQGNNYYFVYQTSGLPYSNQLSCNCGGTKWCFNIEHPCYKVSRDKWTEWSMVAGVSGTDLTLREDWGTGREAQGMILHGDFACDTLGIICSEHSDWSGNQIDLAIAWALNYKTGSFLTNYILGTEEVSRPVLLGTEQWVNNMTFYESRYKEMIVFIADHIETDRNECLKCKSPHGYARSVQML